MIRLGETQMVLWRDLVLDGQERSKVSLTENQEAYLVFVLQQFMRRCELAGITLALSYLEAVQSGYHLKKLSLGEVGDTALVLAGLFPERARKLNVSASYFMKISEMCFLDVAQVCIALSRQGEAALYKELSQNVTRMATVLASARAANTFHTEAFSFHTAERLH